MNEVVTYIVTIAPSLTAILTVIISLLTMINRISKIVVNIHKDNEQLKDEVAKKIEDAEVKKLTDQIDVLAQQNSELSNQIAELTKSYTRVNKWKKAKLQ